MNLNWELLRKQKAFLLGLATEADESDRKEDADMLDGIYGVFDYLQDYAVDNGNATKEEVFGPSTDEGETR